MSDDFVKEVAKKLPSAAHLGHGGLKKPQMLEALFESIFSVLKAKKPAPKNHEARAKARDLANSLFKKKCSQTNGHFFWNSETNKE
jgi:hypothetical protein